MLPMHRHLIRHKHHFLTLGILSSLLLIFITIFLVSLAPMPEVKANYEEKSLVQELNEPSYTLLVPEDEYYGIEDADEPTQTPMPTRVPKTRVIGTVEVEIK